MTVRNSPPEFDCNLQCHISGLGANRTIIEFHLANGILNLLKPIFFDVKIQGFDESFTGRTL
jgi:hypothetical protein